MTRILLKPIINDVGIINNLKTITGFTNGSKTDTNSGIPVLKKVLIIEDEAILGDALESKLKNEGFITSRAENGQLGLDSIKSQKPDVVLLDLIMPVMDGKSMLRELRNIPEFKHLPVIVLTNAGTIDNMKETKLYDDASDFLIKSNTSMDEIVSRVRTITTAKEGIKINVDTT